MRLLEGAARPLIIAGGGARRAGAQLRRLVEWLDCPLVTTAAGKGVLPESHPANFGTSLPYAPIQQLIFDADVVLAVGTEMGETDVYTALRLPLGGRLIRIDVDPVKLSDPIQPRCVFGPTRARPWRASIDPCRRARRRRRAANPGRAFRLAHRARRRRHGSLRHRERFGCQGAGLGERAARHQGRNA